MSNAWMVRPKPNHNDRMDVFLKEKIIAIAWSATGDLTGKSRDSIKTILGSEPHKLSGNELGRAYSSVDIFVNKMNFGDLVVVPDNNDIHFCKIASDYKYVVRPGMEEFPHQRAVEWLGRIDRNDLPINLRSSLKAQNTAANLTKHMAAIEALSSKKELPQTTSPSTSIKASYPLRQNLNVVIEIPSDMTQIESERLANFIRTLYYK